MKSCPYCKEEVRDDALKCRYCQSQLMPFPAVAPATNADDRVTYVLDRGFFRFAKFAVGVLAIFLVVGAYLFGFKLEASLEKVREVQDQVKATSDKLKESQREMENATATVANLKIEVERVLSAAKLTVGEINEQKAAAVAIVVSIRELTPSQESALRQAKLAKSDQTRSGTVGKYWANGTTLRVRFLGGTPVARKGVQEAAALWTQHANLKIKFVPSGDAEIRIAFKQGEGSWSFVGTDALGVPKDQPTMNFGWEEARTYLHEFGHAIGLIEEHQNPAANIKWNTELVYLELSGPPNNWPRETIDSRVLKKVAANELGDYRAFDPLSIMTMAFSSSWTGGVAIGNSKQLSESDKALVGRLYPK